jgi:hypothetical protein
MAYIEKFDIVQTGAGKDCWENIIKEDVKFSDLPCAWDFGGIMLFSMQFPNTACQMEGEDVGIVCYNNPTELTLMFRS